MKAHILKTLAFLVAMTGAAQAMDRAALGWGYLATNDVFFDRLDRWRTGSVALSHVRGAPWTGQRPTRFGELIEFRLRTEVISPANVTTPPANDRRYVGALSVGAHTHFRKGEADISLGVDLIVVGPQTGLDDVQQTLHDIFDGPAVNVGNFQVPNAIYPTFTGEVARRFALGGNSRIRPFVEVQIGAETLLRVGSDMIIGSFGRDTLQVRDVTTGHLYDVMDSDNRGLSLIFGADAAYIADSRYLATPGIVAEEARYRVRAGANYGWASGSAFYGLTYLSEEFAAQPEGQIIGSLNVRFDF